MKSMSSHVKLAAVLAAALGSASALAVTTAAVQPGPGSITHDFGTAGTLSNP